MENKFSFTNSVGALVGGLWEDNQSSETLLFIHGVGQPSSNHPIMQKICDFYKEKYNYLKFDFMGFGLSQGNFADFTIANSVLDIEHIVNNIIPPGQKIAAFARSLGGGSMAAYIAKNPQKISKIFFHAPALNTAQVLRQRAAKRLEKEAGWENWRETFPEDLYQKTWQNQDATCGIPKALYQENDQKNYCPNLATLDQSQYLIVQGDNDTDVPLGTLSALPQEQILVVKGGDHRLLEPDMLAQYQDPMIKFFEQI